MPGKGLALYRTLTSSVNAGKTRTQSMPRAGIEPARANAQEILSLSWLPLHHLGKILRPRWPRTILRGALPRIIKVFVQGSEYTGVKICTSKPQGPGEN